MTAESCSGGELNRITTLLSPGPQPPSVRNQQHYDPECAKVEAWLDEHREFAYDYFIRYCTTDAGAARFLDFQFSIDLSFSLFFEVSNLI